MGNFFSYLCGPRGEAAALDMEKQREAEREAEREAKREAERKAKREALEMEEQEELDKQLLDVGPTVPLPNVPHSVPLRHRTKVG